MDDQLVFPKFLKIICVLWLSISLVFGEYTCLCNYSIETPVYSDADESSVPIGFLYEFDCKYLINVLDENRWAVVAFKHQVSKKIIFVIIIANMIIIAVETLLNLRFYLTLLFILTHAKKFRNY